VSIEVVQFDSTYHDSVWSLAEEILCREYAVLEHLRDEPDLADIAAAYAPPDGTFLVALEQGRVVGTGGVLHISEHDCELKRLYVRATDRRQGIASTLMGDLLDFIRQRGYKRILLEVRPEMQETIKAYTRYGFAPLEDAENLPRPGEFLAIRF
jgi:ribosomal protein S18 acetylase RimI-like enzyme